MTTLTTQDDVRAGGTDRNEEETCCLCDCCIATPPGSGWNDNTVWRINGNRVCFACFWKLPDSNKQG